MLGRVNKIIPFSSVDGPGNRTAVFLQGCNIDCRYCHNPETRDKYGDPAITSVRELSAKEVMAEVEKQRPFISGITVSGGECMLQPEFLLELFTLAKEKGLGTLIDSNGTIDFSSYPALMEVTDGVMLDIKAFDAEVHKSITGASNEMVLKNAVYLAKNHKLLEVRCVISPSLYDGVESVTAIGKYLREYYNLGEFHFKLISYRPMGVRPEYAHEMTPGTDYMNNLSNILNDMGYRDTIIV